MRRWRGRRRPRFGNRFRSTVWRRLGRRELKIAGEGSDDWAPLEAEDMVPALDAEVQGDKKLEAGWQGQEDRGKSRKKTAGRGMVTGAALEACRVEHTQCEGETAPLEL